MAASDFESQQQQPSHTSQPAAVQPSMIKGSSDTPPATIHVTLPAIPPPGTAATYVTNPPAAIPPISRPTCSTTTSPGTTPPETHSTHHNTHNHSYHPEQTTFFRDFGGVGEASCRHTATGHTSSTSYPKTTNEPWRSSQPAGSHYSYERMERCCGACCQCIASTVALSAVGCMLGAVRVACEYLLVGVGHCLVGVVSGLCQGGCSCACC